MDALQTAQELNSYRIRLVNEGYTARFLQDGTLEVMDPVIGGRRITYKNVVLHNRREAIKFIQDRS